MFVHETTSLDECVCNGMELASRLLIGAIIMSILYIVCTVSSLQPVQNKSNNLSPTGAQGDNVTLSFNFTGSCKSSPTVEWKRTTQGNWVPIIAEPLPNANKSLYMARYSIHNISKISSGVYAASVCGNILQYFTLVLILGTQYYYKSTFEICVHLIV